MKAKILNICIGVLIGVVITSIGFITYINIKGVGKKPDFSKTPPIRQSQDGNNDKKKTPNIQKKEKKESSNENSANAEEAEQKQSNS